MVRANTAFPNHGKAVYGIRNLLRYGIARKASVWNQADKDTRKSVMPCRASFVGLDKKKTSEQSSDVFFFGDP